MEDKLQEIATEFHPEFRATCISFVDLIYDYTVYRNQVARSALFDTECFIVSPPYAQEHTQSYNEDKQPR